MKLIQALHYRCTKVNKSLLSFRYTNSLSKSEFPIEHLVYVTIPLNIWDAAKVILKGNWIALNTCIRKFHHEAITILMVIIIRRHNERINVFKSDLLSRKTISTNLLRTNYNFIFNVKHLKYNRCNWRHTYFIQRSQQYFMKRTHRQPTHSITPRASWNLS